MLKGQAARRPLGTLQHVTGGFMLNATFDTMGPYFFSAMVAGVLAAAAHLARRALSAGAETGQGGASALPVRARRAVPEPILSMPLTPPPAAVPPVESASAPEQAAPARAPAVRSVPQPQPRELIDALRDRMDEVSYDAGAPDASGAPNVLAMTKRLEDETGDGEGLVGGARFSVREQGGRVHLRLEGAFDALAAGELRPQLEAAVSPARSVSIDLAGLELIDSSGVATLVALARRSREAGGTTVFHGLRGQPLSVFKLLQLDRVLTLS